MARKKQKTNNAAVHHQKHFWGSLLVGLLLWIFAAALPLKYENLIFMAITGGIFCGFYAFMVIATYNSSGRLRPSPQQMRQRRDEEAAARLSLDHEQGDMFDAQAFPSEELSQSAELKSAHHA